MATFNFRGVKGTVEFVPVADTNQVSIEVSLDGVVGLHGWHIHNLPVDMTVDPTIRCSTDQIGGHYDPLMAVEAEGSNYKTACSNNASKCEIGDLSGKFGPIPIEPSTYTDETGLLTLSGRYGIIGRSIKFHGMQDAGNDVCTTILSTNEVKNGASATILKASFIYPVAGSIYMRQVEGEATRMWGKVYWVTDEANITVQHDWHIHINIVSLD